MTVRRGSLVAILASLLNVDVLQHPTFRSNTEAVTVDVVVLRGNKPVPGLAAQDFQLTDNGILQKIELMTGEEIALDISLIVDTTSSVAGELDDIVESIRQFSASLRDSDRIRLMTFSTALKEVLQWQSPRQPLTLGNLTAQGTTAVYDAIAQALLRSAAPGRRHVQIALTDGEDHLSVISADQLTELARRCDCVFYAAFLSSLDGKAGRVLETVAAATGGRVHEAHDPRTVAARLRAIIDEFRASYILRYVPSVGARGWHQIQVQVVKPGIGSHTVRARRGYFAG
jgi:VWFA-related protein